MGPPAGAGIVVGALCSLANQFISTVQKTEQRAILGHTLQDLKPL
jgi:hypothetical protein